VDHIQFGDCHVGKPYTVTFTITNRSRTEAMRFEWLAAPPFHFSPQVSWDGSAFPRCLSPAQRVPRSWQGVTTYQ